MNLAIDIGNTLIKCAVFKDDQIIQVLSFEDFDAEQAKTLLKMFPDINSIILSSVIKHSDALEKIFLNYNFISLGHSTPLPLTNKYKSPETLGNDRLASAVAANYMFPFENTLIIDAGTCIKYDFVNSDNEYMGGGISPGIKMRFKALNYYTDKLPLLESEKKVNLIGCNTNESIWSGVQLGAISEVKGVISMYEEIANKLKVILTGGDSIFFDKELKNSIFVDPYLILKGLNIILNYNKGKK